MRVKRGDLFFGSTGPTGPTGPSSLGSTGSSIGPTGPTGAPGVGLSVDSSAGGLVATGTSAVNALQLSQVFNVIVGGVTGSGVALPTGATGAHCIVRNSGPNPVQVYPRIADNAAINLQTVGSSITVPSNWTGHFESIGVTQWFSIP